MRQQVILCDLGSKVCDTWAQHRATSDIKKSSSDQYVDGLLLAAVPTRCGQWSAGGSVRVAVDGQRGKGRTKLL